ncbi:MAG: Mrp/NBP35 family ATP-binding protein [Desulfurococcaceae archaeon]
MAARKPTSPFRLFSEAESRLKGYKYKIMVLSGKGGVGKTFVSSMLALALAELGYRVGLLDADLHGSSVPSMYGLRDARHHADEDGIIPIEGPLGVKVVSVNFMLESPELPLIWRGPIKSRAIAELLSKVKWGEGDFFIVDMPPGTGDEAITVVQTLKELTGAVVVTAPNVLSETVVAKALHFVNRTGVRLLGIVENMSYFRCPDTGKEYQLLGKSTGEELARKFGTKLLARIPLDPYIGEAIDKGVPYLLYVPEGDAAKSIRDLATRLVHELGMAGNQ